MRQIGGVAYVKAGTFQLALRGSLTVMPGGHTREPQVGQDGMVHGFTDQGTVPKITGTFTNPGKDELAALVAKTDMTVTAELNSGESWVLVDATVMNERSIDMASGEISLEFAGTAME